MADKKAYSIPDACAEMYNSVISGMQFPTWRCALYFVISYFCAVCAIDTSPSPNSVYPGLHLALTPNPTGPFGGPEDLTSTKLNLVILNDRTSIQYYRSAQISVVLLVLY